MERLRRTSQQLLLRCRRSSPSIKGYTPSLFHGDGRTPLHFVKRPLEFHRELSHRASYYILRNRMGMFQASKDLGLGSTYKIQQKSFSSASINVQRSPLFSTLNSDDVSYFKEILGDKNVIQDEDRLLVANVDWMRKYKGSSQLLLLPKSTEEGLNCYCSHPQRPLRRNITLWEPLL